MTIGARVIRCPVGFALGPVGAAPTSKGYRRIHEAGEGPFRTIGKVGRRGKLHIPSRGIQEWLRCVPATFWSANKDAREASAAMIDVAGFIPCLDGKANWWNGELHFGLALGAVSY